MRRASLHAAASLALIGAQLGGLWWCLPPEPPQEPTALDYAEGVPWGVLTSPADLKGNPQPVLVAVSADWSLHSHANDLLLDSPEVRATLIAHRVQPLRAEWDQPVAQQWLAQTDSPSLFFTALLPAGGGAPVLLPVDLSHAAIQDALAPSAG